MKWLRWQGLVAFFSLLALIAVLWWWLGDWWIARTLERVGTDTMGAEVNVADVDLRLADGQFELNGLQLTNAKQPQRNLLEIGHIEARFDKTQLAWRRIHIEHMDLRDIRFNTERQSPGWVSPEGPKGIAGLIPEIASFDLSALSDSEGALAMLDSLKLESLGSVQRLQTDIEQAREAFEAKRQRLPDEAKIEEYQQRFKQLKADQDGKGLQRGLALLGKGKELDKLRKEIKADLNNVKAMREQLQSDYQNFKSRYQEIRAAPSKDVDRLLANFSFEAPGSEQLVSGALGPTLEAQLNDGMRFYQNAEPWINKARVVAGQDLDAPPPPARAEGVDVHYPERQPQPEFWLKQATLSGSLSFAGWRGVFDGSVEHVTDQPALVGKPIRVALKGGGEAGGTFMLDASVDAEQRVPAVQVRSQIDGIALGQYVLSADPQLGLTSNQATLSAQLTGSRDAAGGHLDLAMRFRDLSLSVQSNQDNAIVQSIINELGKTDTFDLSLNYQRKGDEVMRRLKSSLDDVVKKAIRAALKQELAKHTDKVRQKLMAQAETALAPVDGALQQFGGLDSLLKNKEDLLEGMLGR